MTNCWWGDLAISGAESHYFGRYDSYCSNVDAIAYGNPRSLTVWAAGNDRDDSAPPAGSQYVTFTNGTPIWSTTSRPHDYAKGGYDTITDRGLAKNVLTVGAVYKIVGGYGGTGTVNMSAFSGWGPTDDGRIKPDVVAAGVGLFTPVRHPGLPSATNYYTTNAVGTSFSSPSAAGAVGLLVDLRARLVPQHPFLSSTLKGLLIHTADEAASIGPDYRTGWGLVNADTAASLIQADHDTGQPASQDLSIILSGIVPETRSKLVIVEADFSGGSELILWPSVVGQNYRVQAAVDLLEQVWTNISAEISATKTTTAWESGITPDGELQFYRLIETN